MNASHLIPSEMENFKKLNVVEVPDPPFFITRVKKRKKHRSEEVEEEKESPSNDLAPSSQEHTVYDKLMQRKL